jgi:UDP-N-acetylmuramate dehydrogenase
MPLPLTTAAALSAAGIEFSEDAPLERRTWWRVGGPADGLIAASTLEALSTIQRTATDTACPVTVLGNGSNVLVSDAGIRGLVVKLEGELADAIPDDQRPPHLKVGGGMKLVALLTRAQKYGWTGLECFAGIPGTVGGAVRMNAGSTLGETGDALVAITVVEPSGTVRTVSKADLNLSYRTCHLPPGAIIASAELATTGADADASAERVRTFIERRKATQPLDKPSCGSTFRNPPGNAAGRLIEAAGLKGFRIGAAQVSEKHANFVLNLGGATAADIRSVIETVQKRVFEHSGVELEREVHYLGEW